MHADNLGRPAPERRLAAWSSGANSAIPIATRVERAPRRARMSSVPAVQRRPRQGDRERALHAGGAMTRHGAVVGVPAGRERHGDRLRVLISTTSCGTGDLLVKRILIFPAATLACRVLYLSSPAGLAASVRG